MREQEFRPGSEPALIRSVLYLPPRAGGSDDIVGLYRREEILETALRQDGCLSAELQVPREPDAPILVTALWRDAGAYEGWLANPLREATRPKLAELVEGDFDAAVRGAVYDVVLAVEAQAS
jgi:quinol monooxygenase YgiN